MEFCFEWVLVRRKSCSKKEGEPTIRVRFLLSYVARWKSIQVLHIYLLKSIINEWTSGSTDSSPHLHCLGPGFEPQDPYFFACFSFGAGLHMKLASSVFSLLARTILSQHLPEPHMNHIKPTSTRTLSEPY